MTEFQLNKNLDKALIDFSTEMRLLFSEDDFSQATKSDLDDLSRNVFYLASNFKDEVVKYLKSNKD